VDAILKGTQWVSLYVQDVAREKKNLAGLMAVNRDVIGQAETMDRSDRGYSIWIPARARCRRRLDTLVSLDLV
jgi:hypothetical protein